MPEPRCRRKKKERKRETRYRLPRHSKKKENAGRIYKSGIHLEGYY